MSDEHEMVYARIESLEGLLQRGRGLGAVRALRDPLEAAAFVYDGIRRDWRWDSTDDRCLYLARLVRDLGLSLTPVLRRLAGDEETCLRACDVLASTESTDGTGTRTGTGIGIGTGMSAGTGTG
ncbi:hypothetical protein ACWCPD_27165 [Streptomyces sp. NPDC001935]